jgi:hypothetical protein
MAVSRRHAERTAREEIDEVMAAGAWDTADELLASYAARFGEPADGALLRKRVASGRQLGFALTRARALMRADGPHDPAAWGAAVTALDAVDPDAVPADELRRARTELVDDLRLEYAHALVQRRCADASKLAAALRVADPNGQPPAPCEAELPRAPELHLPARHPGGVASEPSTRARDQIERILAAADKSARRCFSRAPSYSTTMKVRVTAFPGSDHFVATAISTGPLEIRSCLESLFKTAHPPKVSAAISAERLYAPGTDEE